MNDKHMDSRRACGARDIAVPHGTSSDTGARALLDSPIEASRMETQVAGTVSRAWREGFRFKFPGGTDVILHHPDGRDVPEWLSGAQGVEFHNGARLLDGVARMFGEERAQRVAEGRQGVSGSVDFEGMGKLPFRLAPTNHTRTQGERNKAKAARRAARKGR